MKQVLLVLKSTPEPLPRRFYRRGHGGSRAVRTPISECGRECRVPPPYSSRYPRCFDLWVCDDVQIGEEFSFGHAVYVVDSIRGTHFSTATFIQKCERPRRHHDNGEGVAIPIVG
jgi:hypothetical protein